MDIRDMAAMASFTLGNLWMRKMLTITIYLATLLEGCR